MPEKPTVAIYAAHRSRAVYVHPCIMLDISKPMNNAALTIRIAIALSVHLTNANPY
jgi:hypothetical protein